MRNQLARVFVCRVSSEWFSTHLAPVSRLLSSSVQCHRRMQLLSVLSRRRSYLTRWRCLEPWRHHQQQQRQQQQQRRHRLSSHRRPAPSH